MTAELIAGIGWLVLGVVYAIIIFCVLHSVFDYVFFGDGFLKHIIGVLTGGLLLATLTLALWKVIAVLVGIGGSILAISHDEKDKKITTIILTVVLIGIIAFLGSTVMQYQ